MTAYPAWTPASRAGIVPLHPYGFGTILGRSFVALRHNPRVLLGFALVWCFRLLRRGVLLRTVTLTALTGVFYIPRDSAMGWLQFLVTLQFWLAVGGACAGAAILLWLRRRLQREGRDPLGFLTRPLLAKYRWFVPRQPQKQ